MKVVSMLAALCLLPGVAAAGEVYGKIVEGSGSVGENATVQVACQDKTYGPAKTDASGSFHVVVETTGKCKLTVSYKQQSASLDIASYDEAMEYDLAVALSDGKLSVRRK